MSYQVLARKWRPRSFQELVGQSHVLQALVNALDQDRLHHAYLFTGTRGVGKTTIARIFAKCLNCEQGVSSTPCGQCPACKEIDEGRFVDLIEVDAASRTRVEDTRELLDNVQYAPTRGRYKVYLIDEVHMLSSHSFNALLKTLEEPPPHVKFLLATTDPQKLPVTILSRCLQFSLKNMTPERIVGHLEHILKQEQIPCEPPALWQLARSADGSMRDALSLTDQAIAFGNGRIREVEVGAMLGTIDQGQVLKMVTALASGNAAHILRTVSALAEYSPDYLAVLDDMLCLLHRVAIAQAVPDAVDNSQGDREQVVALAGAMTAEDVQLYYQIGLVGKKDLPLAPDPRGGFEMALLRMLAFRPDGAPAASQPLDISGDDPVNDDVAQSSAQGPVSDYSHAEQLPPSPEVVDQEVPPVADAFEPPVIADTVSPPLTGDLQNVSAVTGQQESPAPVSDTISTGDDNSAPVMADIPPPDYDQPPDNEPVFDPAPPAFTDQHDNADEPKKPEATELTVRSNVAMPAKADRLSIEQMDPKSWIRIYRQLPLGGVTGTIGSHCEFIAREQEQVRLRLDEQRSTLYNDTHRQRLEKVLSDYFEQTVKLSIDTGPVVHETPARWRERKIAQRLDQARASITADGRVQMLVDIFSAMVLEDTIAPVGNIIQ